MLSFTFLGFYDTMKRYGSSEKGCRNLFWGGDAPMLFWIVGVVAIVCVSSIEMNTVTSGEK